MDDDFLMGDADWSTVGAMVRAMAQGKHPGMMGKGLVQRPGWMKPQPAPGTHIPNEGMVLLPLKPDVNNGVFTPAFTAITFSARPQMPWRGERPVATVARSTGATGVIIDGHGFFVGTTLQQAQQGTFDIEDFDKTAFGVRQYWTPSNSALDVSIDCTVVGTIPAGESVAVRITVHGRALKS